MNIYIKQEKHDKTFIFSRQERRSEAALSHVPNTIFNLRSLDETQDERTPYDLTINSIGITKRSLTNKSYLDINRTSPQVWRLRQPAKRLFRAVYSFRDYRKFQSLLVS